MSETFIPMPLVRNSAPPLLTLIRTSDGLIPRDDVRAHMARVTVNNAGGEVTLTFPLAFVAFSTIELELQRVRDRAFQEGQVDKVADDAREIESLKAEIAELRVRAADLGDRLAAAIRPEAAGDALP